MIAFVALLAMMTFAVVAMAQTPVKPTAPAVTGKPSPLTLVSRVRSKAISLSLSFALIILPASYASTVPETLIAFGVSFFSTLGPSALVFSVVDTDVKDRAKVTVMIKKERDKLVATTITVVAEKKVEEKKPTPDPAEKEG
jgi:hypothetical protein